MPYSPLGRGFLTGQFKRFEDLAADDFRRMSPRFQGENFQKNLDLVKKIEEIAREKNCTAAQLALAWVLAQGDDIAPIPGTKRRKYLEQNLEAVNIKLMPKDLARIDEVAPKGVAAGARYPERAMAALDNSCQLLATSFWLFWLLAVDSWLCWRMALPSAQYLCGICVSARIK